MKIINFDNKRYERMTLLEYFIDYFRTTNSSLEDLTNEIKRQKEMIGGLIDIVDEQQKHIVYLEQRLQTLSEAKRGKS